MAEYGGFGARPFHWFKGIVAAPDFYMFAYFSEGKFTQYLIGLLYIGFIFQFYMYSTCIALK